MRKAKRIKYRAMLKQISNGFWDDFFLERQLSEDYYRPYEEERYERFSEWYA